MRTTEYELVAGPDEVSVDATADGKTLETLLSKALDTNLRILTLIVQASVSHTSGPTFQPLNVQWSSTVHTPRFLVNISSVVIINW